MEMSAERPIIGISGGGNVACAAQGRKATGVIRIAPVALIGCRMSPRRPQQHDGLGGLPAQIDVRMVPGRVHDPHDVVGCGRDSRRACWIVSAMPYESVTLPMLPRGWPALCASRGMLRLDQAQVPDRPAASASGQLHLRERMRTLVLDGVLRRDARGASRCVYSASIKRPVKLFHIIPAMPTGLPAVHG